MPFASLLSTIADLAIDQFDCPEVYVAVDAIVAAAVTVAAVDAAVATVIVFDDAAIPNLVKTFLVSAMSCLLYFRSIEFEAS